MLDDKMPEPRKPGRRYLTIMMIKNGSQDIEGISLFEILIGVMKNDETLGFMIGHLCIDFLMQLAQCYMSFGGVGIKGIRMFGVYIAQCPRHRDQRLPCAKRIKPEMKIRDRPGFMRMVVIVAIAVAVFILMIVLTAIVFPVIIMIIMFGVIIMIIMFGVIIMIIMIIMAMLMAALQVTFGEITVTPTGQQLQIRNFCHRKNNLTRIDKRTGKRSFHPFMNDEDNVGLFHDPPLRRPQGETMWRRRIFHDQLRHPFIPHHHGDKCMKRLDADRNPKIFGLAGTNPHHDGNDGSQRLHGKYTKRSDHGTLGMLIFTPKIGLS